MAVQAIAQMNIRMASAVKEAGDAVLAQDGTSPTALVRALWDKISRGSADLRQVEEVLGMAALPREQDEASSNKLRAMRRGRGLCAEGLADLGLLGSTSLPADQESERDQYADALVARMQERGLW